MSGSAAEGGSLELDLFAHLLNQHLFFCGVVASLEENIASIRKVTAKPPAILIEEMATATAPRTSVADMPPLALSG